MNTPETTLSFAYREDDEEVVLVDRSTLERYSQCPAQARLIESGAVLDCSLIAEEGNAVHEAFSQAVTLYIDEPDIPLGALAEGAMSALRSSRPDIQPGALAAGRPAAWSWARFLSNHSPKNIVRYDGGEGERSGQLAVDFPIGDVTLRITSELDLLLATPAKQVLREVDYKSGWKRHGIDSIAASFQFGMHAWLVFQNYPDVEALEVQVWQTRTNTLTYPVTFDRSRFKELDTRIRAVVGEYVRYRNRAPQETPTWPAVEKCSACQAAALCPASKHCGHVSADPGKFVDNMVALQAELDAREELAAAYVKATGADIVSPSGSAFGFDKPKQVRKTKALYSVQTMGESDE